MAVSVEVLESLAAKFDALFRHLDERQRRLLMGAEAHALGYGGITVVAAAAGASPDTVRKGLRELASGDTSTRVRRRGGGRKRADEKQPTLVAALNELVDPDTRGDPESPLRWTSKSTRQLAVALGRAGHSVSEWVVRRLLKENGYSLQSNVKTLEGASHPDRDRQFQYLNEQVKAHMAIGDPVISVDTKKKELIGAFKNNGAEWQPTGHPDKVNVHDFIDPTLGKAIPYGIYDLTADAGWVSVGCDHDTAAFAVQSIRNWWKGMGQARYPDAKRLMISADAGGSNGYRLRAFKAELADLATETGLAITVCHLPPGTSKWNKIEHRLFAHISMNWRGRPLTSHEVIINLIANTTTRTGLTVHAEADNHTYPLKTKISDKHMRELEKHAITRHDWHPKWNYTVHPQH